MAFKQISSIYFLADTKEDLANIPVKTMGAECFVIKDAMEYKQTSTGEWIAQTLAASGGSNEPQVQADWDQSDTTAVDFIKNKPFGIVENELIATHNYGEELNLNLSGFNNMQCKIVYTTQYNTIEYYGTIHVGHAISIQELDTDNTLYRDDTLEGGAFKGFTFINDGDLYTNIKIYLIDIVQVDKKFVPGANWAQNDKTAADYIKNKPFGTETVKEKIENIYQLQSYDGKEIEVIYEDGTSQTGVVNSASQGTGIWYWYLRSQETGKLIWDCSNYGEGQWYDDTPVCVYVITTEVKTLNFDSLPIKQLDYLSQVNPTMDLVAAQEPTEKTGQEAYDYAVSVNNTLLQLIESYNSLIEQLNSKGYVNQI